MKRVLFSTILLFALIIPAHAGDDIGKKRAFVANKWVKWASEVTDWEGVKENLEVGQYYYFGSDFMGSVLAPLESDRLTVINKEPLTVTKKVDVFGIFTKKEVWLSKGDQCEPIVTGLKKLVAIDGDDLAFEYIPEKTPRMIDLMGWYMIDSEYFNFHTNTCPAGVIFPQTVDRFISEQKYIAYRYNSSLKEIAAYEKQKAIDDANEQRLTRRNAKLSELAEKSR